MTSRKCKRIVHVNQHNIKHNQKHGTKLPVLTVKCRKSNHKGFTALITGWALLKYQPDRPLPCGARVWLETYDTVVLDRKTI